VNIRLPWHIAGLLAVGVAALVLAILEIGPNTSSAARTERETITATRGVVQSTVTGTGNVAAGVDDDVNFQTSGTLQHVYVHQGEHVTKGQLLATLDPSSEQLTVKEDELSLTSAEDSLKNAEDETVSDSSTDTSATVADAAEFVDLATTATTDETTEATETTPGATTVASTTTTGTSTTSTGASTTTATTTTPETTTSSETETEPEQTTTESSGDSDTSSGDAGSSAASGSTGSTSGESTGSTSGSSTSGSSSSGTTAASKASDVASAESSVDEARANLRTAEQAVKETRLYAPATGTIVSMEGLAAGDAVSGSTSSSSSSSTSSASSDSSTEGSTGSDSTSSTSSSDTAFAEIVNASKLTMTVSFDESDISEIKVGEPATVTIEALTGVELGAHVTAISTVGTESSDVVTYDATLTLDQSNAKVKPGMSADAAVITKQASGVTLPTDAVSGTGSTATVELLKNGTTTPTTVDIGVRGDSRVQIVGGLKAGQQVQITESLPSTGSASSSSSSSSSSGTLGGTSASSGGFGAAGGGFPGGGAGGFGGR
jgi:multidrug efflux pump subunit AcrA (membrane-fusion protein)